MSGQITFRSMTGVKAKRPRERRPFKEILIGDSLFRKTGVWNHLVQVIDRANNWYHKRVTDPRTGEVLRECDEPLTKHLGRGSAKPPADAQPEEPMA